jgi:hypothetical protein
MVARDKETVPAGEFGEQVITVGLLPGEFEELRPQKLCRTEHKNIDGGAQGQWIDGRHRPADDHQGIPGRTIPSAAGDSCGIEGVDQIDCVEFERTRPSEEIEGRERSVILEGPPEAVRWGKEPLEGDVRDISRKLNDPLEGEGGESDVVSVRVTDSDPEATLAREIDSATFVSEQIRFLTVTDSPSHPQTVSRGAREGYGA